MQSRLNSTPTMAEGAGAWGRRVRLVTCLLAMAAASASCDFSQSSGLTNQAQPKQSIHDPAASPVPDANAQMQMQAQHSRKAGYEAANTERKRQLTDDSAALLELSNQLKAEIDKSSKDTLSVDVVRKADEIAKLAHNVQVKMKLTVNAAY